MCMYSFYCPPGVGVEKRFGAADEDAPSGLHEVAVCERLDGLDMKTNQHKSVSGRHRQFA